MSARDPEKLEAVIHRALRSVPNRKAPAGLEGRVMAELSRRASRAWWRKSYAHWPSSVRVAFLASSAVAAALIVTGLFSLGQSAGAHELTGDVAHRFSWLVLARETFLAVASKLSLIVSAVPSLWLYGVLGTIGLCYAALGAIGAALYRCLSLGRPPSAFS
jgi:hypothetical protein